jgi:hypothetical protein
MSVFRNTLAALNSRPRRWDAVLVAAALAGCATSAPESPAQVRTELICSPGNQRKVIAGDLRDDFQRARFDNGLKDRFENPIRQRTLYELRAEWFEKQGKAFQQEWDDRYGQHQQMSPSNQGPAWVAPEGIRPLPAQGNAPPR